MKLDSFTTARCIKCGWLKQFQPGKEYEAKEFKCNCSADKAPQPTQFDRLMDLAKRMNLRVAHNISEENLLKKIKEAQSGKSTETNQED